MENGWKNLEGDWSPLKAHEVSVNKKLHRVKIVEKGEGLFSVDLNGKNVEVKFTAPSGGKNLFMEVNGKMVQVEVVSALGNTWHVRVNGKTFEVQYPISTIKTETMRAELAPASSKESSASFIPVKNAVLAPIAGRIVALKVNVGQRVSRGDCICILEAMKMANEVAAPWDGIVKEICVSEGAVVNKGDVLAVIA